MNPYSVSRPVTDPAMFFGYQPELDYVVSKVTDPRNPRSFAVMGGRYIGKTSLLRQVERRLKAFQLEQSTSNYLVIPLFLDMLQLGDATPGDFLGKAGHLLNRYLSKTSLLFTVSTQIKTLLEAVKSDAEPLDAFTDALTEFVEAAHPYQVRIVFLIDDLWRVKHQEKNEPLTPIIRALAIDPALDQVVVSVITGSYHEIDPNTNQPGSPLDAILKQINLHVFDEEQSLALINKPTQGEIPAEVAHEIFLETGGHPFLLQALMSELCEYENLTQLTTEDIQQATSHFLKERRDFERWGEKLSEADRKVYEVFCRQEQASPDDLHRMMLNIPSVGGRNIILSKPMILDSLRILQTMGLIREVGESDQDGFYELAGQWHARWFLQMNRPTQSLV